MKKKLLRLIKAAGLSNVSDKIMESAQESIRILAHPANEEDMKLGMSKIGGLPDIPKTVNWPVKEIGSLSFIAQINLEEITKNGMQQLLPKSGILYFFYDAEEQPWGYEHSHYDSWRVIYCDDISNLVRVAPSKGDIAVFDACMLEYRTEITLPPYDSTYIERMGLGEEEEAYYDLLEQIEEQEKENDERINRVLGHPNAIQGDMQLQCQLVTNGVDCGDADTYEDSRVEELKKGAEDWILLFQIDSEDAAGMMWGDDGRIYFWIKKEDFKKLNFENVWMILQCG